MKTARLNLTGMSCGHCALTVQEALRNVPGVRSATVHLSNSLAEVEYDESATAPERLVTAVEEEGYGAEVA